MSNRNNLPNNNGDGGAESYNLSQDAVDEGTTDPHQITNQGLNVMIVHRPNHLDGEMSTACIWFSCILYLFVICLCSPLFMLAYILYQLITYGDQPGATTRRSQSRQTSLSEPYCCGWERDATAEGRIAHPIQDVIDFPNTVEILVPLPVGIQNVQVLDPTIIAGANNVQNTNVGTPNPEVNLQTTADEDRTSEGVIDDPTYNINPLNAVESQDDNNHSSNSSDDEEEDLIMSSESGIDGDDENDSADDAERQGQTSLTAQGLPNSVQNNVELNQTNIAHIQPTTASLNPSENEPTEIEGNVAPPADVVRQAITPPVRSTNARNPKPRNVAQPHHESSDEQVS